MAITMTDAAAARVSSFLANRGKGIGLRLGVKTTGCSGLAYVLEFGKFEHVGKHVGELSGLTKMTAKSNM